VPFTVTGPTQLRSIRARVIAILAVVAVLGAVLVEVLPHAGADARSWKIVATNDDAGAVDLNRDGLAEYAPYGDTNAGLAVGEQPRDGADLRLFVPFSVPKAAVDAVKAGGTATVNLRVWEVNNLGPRKLVVEAYNVGTVASKSAYNRTDLTPIATLQPVEGRLGLDLTEMVGSMTGGGRLTLRFRTDQLNAVDGKSTNVNIATSESRQADNRPTLTVTASSDPVVTPPPTVPTTTPPVEEPPTTTTTTPPPPVTAPVIPPPSSVQPPAAITGGANWPLQFSDEFDGTGIDSSKWNVANNSNYGVGNNEIECYMARNATVADGILSLTGKPDSSTGCSGYQYSSGMITTRAFGGGAQKQSWTYGYLESRFKVPEGNIWWSGMASYGANGSSSWPGYGELDAVEVYSACPNMVNQTLHYDGGGHVQTSPDMVNALTGDVNNGTGGCISKSSSSFAGTLTSGFHTFGVGWTPNRITWTVDGKVTYYFDGTNNTMNWTENGRPQSRQFPAPTTNFWNQAHTITLGLAMGGGGPAYFGWSPSNTVGPTTGTMQVDYVRQWGMP
jgi:beta-glucanase (GH16 family)